MRPEFSIRSDSVDVEQIMKQIQSRIREKRGVDYTEEEIRELAKVKLEQFLDPARLRSDLLAHYRARRPGPVPPAVPFDLPPVIDIPTSIDVPPEPENYVFEPGTPYESSRGLAGRLLFTLRRLLNPLLKLFINPSPILHVITLQSAFNTRTTVRFDHLVEQVNSFNARLVEHLKALNLHGLVPLQEGLREGVLDGSHNENARRNIDALNYEVAHNLVLEMTRLGIEVKNMKMRVESIASRLDFTDRRLRALEGVVQYKPGTGPTAEVVRSSAPIQPHAPAQGSAPARAVAGPPAQAQSRPAADPEAQPGAPVKGEAQRARRRRRRRSRSAPGQAPGHANGTPGDAAGAEGIAGADSFSPGYGGPPELHTKTEDPATAGAAVTHRAEAMSAGASGADSLSHSQGDNGAPELHTEAEDPASTTGAAGDPDSTP
jgi:hypothetical protein